MVPDLEDELSRAGRVATRRRLLRVLTRHQFDHEVRNGRLVSPFTGAYCRPWEADFVTERAALVSVGPPAALSHTTGLRRWKLLVDDDDGPVHLSVPATRCPRPRPGMHVHRLARMPPTLRVDGLPTVALPHALVHSWSMLPPSARRAPLISAVRRRLVHPADVAALVTATARVADRAELAELTALLEGGCESELEIWGHLDVFDHPGLRHGVRQLWVRTPAGRFRVDLGYREERVAVELDGAVAHSGRDQRERDMRRDAALASIDWLTMRFSHGRLHADIAGCQQDMLATLGARRPRFRTA